MRLYLWLFPLSIFLFAATQAQAADPQIEILQNNMAQLQQSIQSLRNNMSDLKMTVENQTEVIRQQSMQIAGLQKDRGTATQPSQSGVAALPSGIQKAVGGFNPDIAVVGTTQAKLTQNKSDTNGNNAIALKELELNFSQVVDPFSRMDAVISFNDSLEPQNANIEEAYYTRWGLPLGFTGQIGKFRADIGKENLLHAHQLETVDYPLVIRDFFGDEGLASSGLRLKNEIPNPWDLPLEISGEILRGNNGNSFSGVSRTPIFDTHLKSFFQMTDDTNLELGLTTMFGDENPPLKVLNGDGTFTNITRPQGTDRFGVKIFGGDATFNWFLPEGKKVMCQNELYFQNRTDLVHLNNDPWGFYSLFDYKFSEKFSTGVRFDYLNPLDVGGGHGTTSVSPYFIFWQSEFADMKLQYTHTVPAGGEKTDNAAFFVVDFMIGAHKHAVQ
jgi:hypothetical protein